MSNGKLSGQLSAGEATQEKIMALAVSHMDNGTGNSLDNDDTEKEN